MDLTPGRHQSSKIDWVDENDERKPDGEQPRQAWSLKQYLDGCELILPRLSDQTFNIKSYPSPLPSVKRAPICPSNVSKETEARLLDLMQKQGVKILGRSSEC